MASVAAISNLGAYADNPRGNLWFNDESTYGRKLLMKMGWNKGKGLGKNENGIKENLKVQFRNTNSGLGFKDDAYANIMKTDYESILKNLNAEYSDQKAPNVDKDSSKHKKSRVVKSKLRYPKLFFGKDVTKYTEKDMKSIFICSQPFKDKEEVEDPVFDQKESDIYKSSLSISDYFAMKMQEKKSKTLNKDSSNGPNQQQTSSESESSKSEKLPIDTKASKGKKKEFDMDVNEDSVNDLDLHQDTFDIKCVKTENLPSSPSKKSSKQQKKNSEIDFRKIKEESLSTTENENGSKSSKKKQKLLKNSMLENDLSDNGKISEMGPDQQQTSSESESFKSEELPIDTKASKRKRKEFDMDVNEDSVNDLDLHQDTFDIKCVKTENLPSSPSKKSPKKRKKNSEINFSKIGEDSLSTTENENGSKSSKKKQELLKNSMLENDLSDNGKISEMGSIINNSTRANRKRKRSQICENGVDGLSENGSPCDNESFPVPSKKRKGKNKDRYSIKVELPLENIVLGKNKKIVENSKVESGQSSLGSVEDGLSINNPDCSKKKKKLKKKLKHKLKSCLKNKTGSYSMKNVSFNETVSYRCIDSDFECVGDLSGCQGLDQMESSSEIVNVAESHSDEASSDETSSEEEVKTDEQTGDSSSPVQEELSNESEEGCSLSSLPSSKSSYYNCWIESQRQALKMNMYKNMLKNLKKHKVLRTSNILSIKGYGNWGFK